MMTRRPEIPLRSQRGWAVMHYAAMHGLKLTIALLIERGCKADVPTKVRAQSVLLRTFAGVRGLVKRTHHARSRGPGVPDC
jgi:hypothetical protein